MWWVRASTERSRALLMLPFGLALTALIGCDRPAAVAMPPIGRYVIVHSPHAERDTVLLDTATGQTWQLQEFSDLRGKPDGWVPLPLVNNDKDAAALAAKYGRLDGDLSGFVAKPAN